MSPEPSVSSDSISPPSGGDLLFDENLPEKQAQKRRAKYDENHPEHRGAKRQTSKGDVPAQQARYWRRYKAAHINDPTVPTTRQILGIDGEAQGGKYVYLCAAGIAGEVFETYNDAGLPTLECFEWLCELPPKALKFGFAFTYDINMILGDLSKQCLQRLAGNGWVRWKGWTIWHIQPKRFGLYNKKTGQRCVIWDAFPFVQCSFVKWVNDWKLADEKTLAMLREMKDLRADFDSVNIDEIIAYCQQECRLLALGVRTLIDTCAGAGIHLMSYYGAGSLAQALMKKHGIKEFLPVEYPPEVLRYIQPKNPKASPIAEGLAVDAYFGGRSEMSIIGRISGPIYTYDINSAYPSSIRDVPCLAHGRWVHRKGEEYAPNALVKVTWKMADASPSVAPAVFNDNFQAWFGPFPVRPSVGSIRYPTTGQGWYWGVEVDAARLLCGANLVVKESWEWVSECNHKPFAWVGDTFDLRRALKQAGDMRHIPLKLGLNSLYGKTAQSVGRGTYRCPIWAGMITAGCRAKILEAIAQDPEAILSIATDGIVSKRPLLLDVGSGLGQWEFNQVDWAFFAQCGVYFYGTEGEKVVRKSRGFLAKELSLDIIEDELRHNGIMGRVEVEARRFVGYRTALHRQDWGQWRGWHDIEKTLRLQPMPRRIPVASPDVLGDLVSAPHIGYFRTRPPEDMRPWKPDESTGAFIIDWEGVSDELCEQPDLQDTDGW